MNALLQIASPLQRPSHVSRMFRDIIQRDYPLEVDQHHAREAAAWLMRAQMATGQQGVSRGYSMNVAGWSPPDALASALTAMSLLTGGEWLADDKLIETAVAIGDWIITRQSDSGAVDCEPEVVAKTAACTEAWMMLFEKTTHERFLFASQQAARWLTSLVMDTNRFGRIPKTSAILTARAIAMVDPFDAGIDGRFLTEHVVECVFKNLPRNGSVKPNEISDTAPYPSTFQVATVIDSLLHCCGSLEGSLAIHTKQRALSAAEKTLLRFELNKPRPDAVVPLLPAFFDEKWKSHGKYACNAGCAQTALLWLNAYGSTADGRYLNSVLKILDQLKSQQTLKSADLGVRGAVPGTTPIWRRMGRLHFPTNVTAMLLTALTQQETAIEELKNA